jgi:hypothetical protein
VKVPDDPLVSWACRHPRAMIWVLFATTINLVINVLEAVHLI